MSDDYVNDNAEWREKNILKLFFNLCIPYPNNHRTGIDEVHMLRVISSWDTVGVVVFAAPYLQTSPAPPLGARSEIKKGSYFLKAEN